MNSRPQSIASMLVLLGSLSLAYSARAAAPPVEWYARLPQFRHIALSPSGKQLAWEEDKNGARAITVIEVDSGKTVAAVPIADKLRDLHWSDETTLLMELSATRTVEVDSWNKRQYEFSRTLTYDVGTRQSCVLLMQSDDRYYVTGASLLAARTTAAHTVAMASWDWDRSTPDREVGSGLAVRRRENGWVFNAFAVDTRNCKGTLLNEGTPLTTDWIINSHGKPVARAEWDAKAGRYTLLAKDGIGWRPLVTRDNLGRMQLGGLSAKGSDILAIGPGEDRRSKLWSIPLDGSGAKVLIDDPAAEVTRFVFDDFTQAAIAVELSGSLPELRWLDERAKQRNESLKRTFRGHLTRTVSHSQDFSRVIVEVESATAAPVYYLVDFIFGKAEIVGEPYPELAKMPPAESRPVSYQARDGATIPAYLSLPAAPDPRNLPTIVLPHDGPEERDDGKFNWLVQFLASRGYAVFQPQFRGSTGFGHAHQTAGSGRWGTVMLDDVTDGVRFLVSRGIADPKRTCIMGTGYGAYAALAGAAFAPAGLYACAAGINGIFDLPDYMAYIEQYCGKDSHAAYYWRDQLGSSKPQFGAESPARSARSIAIPVLLMHAERDTVTPFAQSAKMHQALPGNRAQLLKLAGDDHYLSIAASRITVLTELEAFLARHLQPTIPGS